jgi:hypothetical protein
LSTSLGAGFVVSGFGTTKDIAGKTGFANAISGVGETISGLGSAGASARAFVVSSSDPGGARFANLPGGGGFGASSAARTGGTTRFLKYITHNSIYLLDKSLTVLQSGYWGFFRFSQRSLGWT